MSATKVLIVDDSLTMRALFTSALERDKGLLVVGAASGADMARDMIRDFKPDVLTLDIEMPGKNGIEFLGEIMETRPMPVVMLSTLTQKGADVTLKAIEIGAVDCFPKPQRVTPEEFEKISGKLCKLVAMAAKTNMQARRHGRAPARKAVTHYKWDGSLIVVTAGMGGVEALGQMLARFPANCPPTLVVHAMEDGLSTPFAAKLDANCAASVKLVTEGAPLQQGVVYLATDQRLHVVVDRWPDGRVHFLDRGTVNGHRPSADVLFTLLAKTTGSKIDGVILSGGGIDGAAGLAALRAAGARTYCQNAETALIHETASAAVARGAVQHEVSASDMATTILSSTPREIAA